VCIYEQRERDVARIDFFFCPFQIKKQTKKMGCDGGTISNRRDIIVKVRKQTKNKSNETESDNKWSLCALSGEPLDENLVVCCRAGRLYNKESLIKLLLNRKKNHQSNVATSDTVHNDNNDDHSNHNKNQTTATAAANTTTTTTNNGSTSCYDPCPHIKSIRDVVHVQFTSSDKRWICPVTKEELRNGVHTKFYCISKCGHTISHKALQYTTIEQEREEVNGNTHECAVCGVLFHEKNDLIWLNPSDDIVKQRIASEQQKQQQQQQNKKMMKKRKESSNKKRDHSSLNQLDDNSIQKKKVKT
jgi:hypothetical protein